MMNGEEHLELLSMGNVNGVKSWRVRRHGKETVISQDNGIDQAVISECNDNAVHSASPEINQAATSNTPCSTAGSNGGYCSAGPVPPMSSSPHDVGDAMPCNTQPRDVQPQQEVSSSTSISTVSCVVPRLTAEYFDIFVIHRQKDEQKILKMKDILRKFVVLPDGRRLTFSLEEIGIPYIADKYDYFEKSLQQSRYKFIYISVDFSLESCDADDDEFRFKLSQHYALNEMIRRKDSSVVPVTDNPQAKIPMLLDIFRHFSIWRLLRQRSLDDISDVDKLCVDEHSVGSIRHMFDPTMLPTPQSYSAPQHIQLIRTNYSVLSERIDTDSGLLAELYSKDVISHREMETVRAGRTLYHRNEELLNVLRRKDEAKFQQFVAALRATSMNELADMLEINS